MADPEDALAAFRTAVLLARNSGATLSVDLPGKDISSIHFGKAPRSTLASGFLDTVRMELRKLISAHGPDLILEVTITAASFVSEGIISMRVRSANAVLEHQQT